MLLSLSTHFSYTPHLLHTTHTHTHQGREEKRREEKRREEKRREEKRREEKRREEKRREEKRREEKRKDIPKNTCFVAGTFIMLVIHYSFLSLNKDLQNFRK